MRKHLSILMAVIALTLSVVTPAAANPPTNDPAPFPPGGITLDPPICTFPVLVTALQDNAKLITFYDSQGQPRVYITNGAIKLRLTNTTNGKTLDLNVSGPGRFNADFTTLTTWGTWLTYLPTPFTGAPSQLFLVTGHSVFDFNTSSFQLIGGRTENLCPRLA